MTVTFDLSSLRNRCAALRAALPLSAAQHVPEAALQVIEELDYAAPEPDELGQLQPESLLSELVQVGPVTAIAVLQLWDWHLDPEAQHCYSPDGKDCVHFALEGPYTADTIPAQPGDGTTPCKDRCHCELVPRTPLFGAAAERALAWLGFAVRADLAQAWGGA